MFGLDKYIYIGGGVALILILGFGFLQQKKIDRLQEQKGALEVSLATSIESINELTAQRDNDIASLGELRSERSKLRQTLSDTIKELEEFKDNEDLVRADPNSIELIIDDRLEQLFFSISCASSDSDRESCQDSTGETGPTP